VSGLTLQPEVEVSNATDGRGASDAERLAKNEAFFRESNELLRREAAARDARRADFICECAMSGCMERLPISQQAYELVRLSGSEQFIVCPRPRGACSREGHRDARRLSRRQSEKRQRWLARLTRARGR
jgi:hypothetical protein